MRAKQGVVGVVVAGLLALATWPAGCASEACEDESKRVEARLAECGQTSNVSFSCICSDTDLAYAICVTDCYEAVSCEEIERSRVTRSELTSCVEACGPPPNEEFTSFCLSFGDDNGEGGTGAASSGGSGGAGPGSGGAGQGGSGGTAAAIASHTVLSGDVTVNGDGCVQAGAAPGAQLLLDQTIVGATTATVAGQLLPVAGGGEAVSLLQLCVGGAVNGAVMESCQLARAFQSTVDDTGGVVIYDTDFNEAASDSWSPTTTMHDYELTVTTDPSTLAITVTLLIDGVLAASASAPSLGVPGGDRISITMLAATVCAAALN